MLAVSAITSAQDSYLSTDIYQPINLFSVSRNPTPPRPVNFLFGIPLSFLGCIRNVRDAPRIRLRAVRQRITEESASEVANPVETVEDGAGRDLRGNE